jgi:ribosome-binding factor A
VPRDYSRTLRVAEQIQRELADLIRLAVKDPRIGFITLTGVEVTRDYAHAKVFYTTLESGERIVETTAGLNRAAGFLRHELSQLIKLRTMPQLTFVYDESVERGVRLSRLIDDAIAATPVPAKKRR